VHQITKLVSPLENLGVPTSNLKKMHVIWSLNDQFMAF